MSGIQTSKRTFGLRIAFLLVGSITCLIVPITANSQQAIQVSTTAIPNEAAVKLIAEIGQSHKIMSLKQITLVDLAKQSCGYVSAAYIDKLKASNSERVLGDQIESGAIVIPACARATDSIKVAPRPGWGVWDMARSYLPAGKSVCDVGKQLLIDNPDLKFVSSSNCAQLPVLHPSKPVKLSGIPVYSTLMFAPGTTNDTLKQLAAIDRNLRTMDRAKVVFISPHACTLPAGEPEIDTQAADLGLIRAFMSTWSELSAAHKRITGRAPIPKATVIAILDTGLRNINHFKPFIEINGNPNQNGYSDDVYGASIDRLNGDVEPFPESAFADHGTHVAGLAIGGPTFVDAVTSQETEARMLFEIRFFPYKIEKRQSGTLIDVSGILNALNYSRHRQANIVNMSVVAHSNGDLISGIKNDNKNILYVVAAGNDANDFSEMTEIPGVYPAMLGGRKSTNVVTVGAVSKDGQLLSFSNRGQEYVDLFALGQCVQSWVFDGTNARKRYSGTSQATPKVTFIAALLHRLGLTGPKEIKQRLLATVDYQGGLASQSLSGGILNPEKALRLYDDLIVMKNDPLGSYKIGKIDVPFVSAETHSICADKKVSFSNVIRIVVAGQEKIKYALRDRENFEFQECEINQKFTFNFTEDNQRVAQAMSLVQIREVTPRQKR